MGKLQQQSSKKQQIIEQSKQIDSKKKKQQKKSKNLQWLKIKQEKQKKKEKNKEQQFLKKSQTAKKKQTNINSNPTQAQTSIKHQISIKKQHILIQKKEFISQPYIFQFVQNRYQILGDKLHKENFQQFKEFKINKSHLLIEQYLNNILKQNDLIIFPTNHLIIHKIICPCAFITTWNKQGQLAINTRFECLSYFIRKATKIIIGAQIIFSNSMILTSPGMTLIANYYKKQVIVLCESYKFSKMSHVQFQMKTFNQKQNTLNKKYDIINGININTLITQSGPSLISSIESLITQFQK